MDRKYPTHIPQDRPDDLVYLTEKDVAAITGRSIATLRSDRLNHAGIPFHKVGRSIRYKLSDVKSYMAACRKPLEESSLSNRLINPEGEV